MALHEPVSSATKGRAGRSFRRLPPARRPEREITMRIRTAVFAASTLIALAMPGASAQENYESWPPLKSTFESTGGGGFVIKGYDPVIRPNKTCVTTFMAVEPGAEINVYYNI